MTWSTLSQSQSPLTHILYTATLLPSGLIIYIGGKSGSSLNTSLIDMAQVWYYDNINFRYYIIFKYLKFLSILNYRFKYLTQNLTP
ncbi:hypothetical protein C2G38_2116286, partial [Gigaspora rosea]